MADEKDVAPEGGKKKSKLKLIIIIVILLVVLGAGGFVAMKFLAGGSGDKSNKPPSETPAENKIDELGPLYPFESFIINLADSGGSRYLKVTLQVELDTTEGLSAELDKRKPQLRDAILTVLSTKRYEDVSSGQGKIILKKEIIRQLNRLLPKGKVTQVYLTEFVAQ